MEANPAPAGVSEIAKGARVTRPTVRRFLTGLTPAELEIMPSTGWPRYRLRRPDTFEDMLAAATADAPLDEALAGLHRIATAAGIFEDTWHAQSIGEVCDMIAAWCRQRHCHDLAHDHAHAAGLTTEDLHGPATYRAYETITAGQVLEELVPEQPGLVRPWRGTGQPLGQAAADADPGQPVRIHAPAGAWFPGEGWRP
jgi:hypothetical protein